MAKTMNSRTIAALIIYDVVHEGLHLDNAITKRLNNHNNPASNGFIKAMSYGVIRFYPRLLFFLSHLIDKPVRNKEKIVECLLLAGIYETYYMQTPSHAGVSESVKATLDLKKSWAKGLVNAVLRGAIREQETLNVMAMDNDGSRTAHPKWLIKRFKKDWPDDVESILAANNEPGPLTLRVNQKKITRNEYLKLLKEKNIEAKSCTFSKHGIQCAQAVDVEELPAFANGLVSVQDQAAQLATEILNPQAGDYILDACAAPGGKTGHILESQADIDVVALDISEKRIERIEENLQRLSLSCTQVVADAADTGQWWKSSELYKKGEFDRILLDAPCSGTGVIRRHPDIKLHRNADNIVELTQTQEKLLDSLWLLVKTGGMLLYSTCSILADENEQQIQAFLAKHSDANAVGIEVDFGRQLEHGLQVLPGQHDMDGFYYACLYKGN